MRKVIRRMRWALPGLVGIVAAAALAGCSVSGGGEIPGKLAPSATFGFAAVAKAVNGTLRSNVAGTYRDGDVDIRLTGRLDGMSFWSCYGFPADYVSTNPASQGSGVAELQICDSGQGPAGGNDSLSISLSGGPFDGYANSGVVAHGNLTANDPPH